MNDGRTEKITFTCTPGTKAYLREWASRKRLSTSILIDNIVSEAIEENKNELSDQQSQPSIATLVQQWDLRKLAEEALMPIEDLERIAKGERPTDDDIINLGRIFEGFDTAELLKIRKRDFPLAGNGKKKNG
jgi:hypothetical protein